MSMAFDAGEIARHGWRQGAVLGARLVVEARKLAPSGIDVADGDWLIVTSHDCDIVNERLEKEPIVEVVRAEVTQRRAPDKQQVWGRNPRVLQFEADGGSGSVVVLTMKVHERWTLPRGLLALEAPARVLDDKTRRLAAEWLAKRYIRAAFPTAFDLRWRSKMRDWTLLLEKHSQWIQGVYLRLSSLTELDEGEPYKTHFIVAAPAAATINPGWPEKRSEIEDVIETFWQQFAPGVECVGVDVLGTDYLTLAEIEPYQRFDADWISFADDSPMTPPTVDMSG